MAKIKLSRHKLSCKATWSATARANLSILEPASAIFLAALITSEEFFRGPLPLGKFKERRREKRDGGWSCRGRRHAELPFKDCAHPSAAQACREANLLFVALKIWHNTITKTFPDNGWNKYSLPVSLMIHLGDMLWSTLQEGNNLCFKSKTWIFREVTVKGKKIQERKPDRLWSNLGFFLSFLQQRGELMWIRELCLPLTDVSFLVTGSWNFHSVCSCQRESTGSLPSNNGAVTAPQSQTLMTNHGSDFHQPQWCDRYCFHLVSVCTRE